MRGLILKFRRLQIWQVKWASLTASLSMINSGSTIMGYTKMELYSMKKVTIKGEEIGAGMID